MRAAMAIAILVVAGCASLPVVDNPANVATTSYEKVWDTTVNVLSDYFEVTYENRFDGRIETSPSISPTIFEVWEPDAVTFRDRVEATLQTIRRRAFVLVQPAPAGGFRIDVEVYKELEDVARPVATFLPQGGLIASIEPTPEVIVTSPIEAPAGWISRGRDTALEQKILGEIVSRLDGVQPAMLLP